MTTRPLRYLELFAGGGGLSHGLEQAGWACVAHAEIEPHARAVLRRHWPDTPLHGDVTQVDWTRYAGQVDLVAGGSPCQDLSVAGKRAGLAGARSGLFYELIRAWNETGATYCLWENVDGARSSNNGADFAAVLSAFVGATIAVPADRWESGGVAAGATGVAAWRVLDLQHFGPPQRRRRVFVVAARTGGGDPAEVLALTESMCGHPSPREQSRQGAAGRPQGGTSSGGVTIGIDDEKNASHELMGTLNARTKSGGSSMAVMAFAPGNLARRAGANPSVEVVQTLGADTNGDQAPHVVSFHLTQDPISGDVSPALGRTTEGMGVVCTTGDVTHALTHEGGDASEDGTGRGTPIVARIVAFGEYTEDGMASAIKARDHKDATDLVYAKHGRPRRLTPLECERLMGWPDHWTATGVREDGTTYALSDTARYRICGNGVGSPVAAWIGRRLMQEAA